MSLTVDGVWKAGVWATTVWADGVWREGAPTPPTPPSGPPQSGVRNRGGKRRWALRYHGKLYYFDDLRALEAFANQPPAEALRPDAPKRKAKPQIVVPVETIREAKEAGFDGLQKLAERMDFAALRRIEERMSNEDDEDFRDFMSFLRQLDG